MEFLILQLLFCLTGLAAAESGIDAWLRYAPLPSNLQAKFQVPSSIVSLNTSSQSPVFTAGQELQRGIKGVFGKNVEVCHSKESGCSIVVGTVDEYEKAYGALPTSPALTEDGFWLNNTGDLVQILGQNERGALYGAFEYLSMLAQGNFSKVAYATNPNGQLRWVNQWDNMDGSITRGYGGASIFFINNSVVEDLTRAGQYARVLSSIRLNAVVVNDVNANYTTLEPRNIEGLGRIADQFRPYGVKLALALDFASPMELGNLSTYDPVNPEVVSWWENKTAEIYQSVPDMAGFLVKADSEGTPGPLVYNRTLAQGANLFGKCLEPYGAHVMYRAFVYNPLNESDWYADRAKAAVDFFKPLDGQFDENVVIQIKYGPIDFQVREPTHPLFANLLKTSTAIELEVAQEYLGQQCHLVYLPPLWKTVLDFDLRVDNETSLVRDIISGKRFNRPLGGSAAVVNVGTNDTWLGSIPSMSNLYAYGQLAWDPAQDAEAILQDWIRLTFGLDPTIMKVMTDISMQSWPAYLNYSGNLGIQTLTDILYTHYGPNPATQDNTIWGQWTRADHTTVGMDRTCSNGTCYSGQYPPEIYEMYENIDSTPDNLLLWFHHVNWTHVMHSGKTVIQHFYDAHYDGAETAQTFVTQLNTLQGKIDAQRFDDMMARQVYQAGHSIVWRDSIVDFYWNMTGIADVHGRVGHHPHRIDASTGMKLSGYRPYVVNPFEAADPRDYTGVVTETNTTTGTAMTKLDFPDGKYDVAVNYWDMYGGTSTWELYLNDKLVEKWYGNAQSYLGYTPSIYIDGHSAIRKTIHGVELKKGDMLKIVGTPDGVEPAPLDYVAILPPGLVD